MVSEVEPINLQNTPVHYTELSAVPVLPRIIIKKRLKSELAHMRTTIRSIGEDCERLLVDEFHSPAKDGKDQDPMSRKRKSPEASRQPKDSTYEKSEAISSVTCSFKGDKHGNLESQNSMGQIMDNSKRTQCTNVLRTLMNHQHGWPFNQPVDPVKLNIPDYFSIISKPMDLGTIKYRLGKMVYSSTDQFAADVRLTFSNAVRYNPPDNIVHKMAKELNSIFHTKWKALEAKWIKQPITSKQVLQRVPSCNSSSLSSKSLTAADKLKLQNRLAKFSRSIIPPRLHKFLQKACLLEQSGERISIDADALDVDTLWELHQIVKSCGDAGPTKPAGLLRKSQGLIKCNKGTGGTSAISGSVNCRAQTTTSASKNIDHACVGNDRSCIRQSDFTPTSVSDASSEKSSGRRISSSHSIASDSDGENISGAQGFNDSYCTVSRIEVEFPCEELSPNRALRAAMLKSRFAETILKAQQKTLLNHGEKSDPTRMQREREKLKRQQQEEKARIEAQVKAVEASTRMKAEAELKMQREKEREAARLALQKMEKTVDFDENSRFSKDLETLAFSKPLHADPLDEMMTNFMNVVEQQSALVNPLAKLGLFLKEEDLGEELDNSHAEEGEIRSS